MKFGLLKTCKVRSLLTLSKHFKLGKFTNQSSRTLSLLRRPPHIPPTVFIPWSVKVSSDEIRRAMEIEESVGGDRLSELPEGLTHHILSFLPMRDVVSTSLLSKHWQNLWTTVPSLNFCGKGEFRNFVNRALIAWEGTEILKFKIDASNVPSNLGRPSSCDIDLWILFALRHRVKKLKVHLRLGENDAYTAPRCLESSSSIRRLSIQRCNLQIHGSPAWGQLKCLKMYYCYFSNYSISQILSGSPQLEVFDLRFSGNKENLHIVSASLKELCIVNDGYGEPSLDTVLQICCPNLDLLEYLGPLCKCLFTNVSSLTDVTLWFYLGLMYSSGFEEEEIELLGESLRQILPSIQHVEKVALSDWCVEVLGKSPGKYLPSPLLNVKFLEFDVDGKIALGVITNLFISFPNLQTLLIRDSHIPFNAPESYANNLLEFENNFSKSFLGQLKTIDVISPLIGTSIPPLIQFLLKHAPMLEKLVVRVHAIKIHEYTEEYYHKFKKVMLNSPRSSPTAKMIFKDITEL